MKAWVLAGAVTALGVPTASAATTDCDPEEVRPVASQQVRAGAAAAAGEQRADAAQGRAAAPVRQPPPRRRSAKHIPDAELIGANGTL